MKFSPYLAATALALGMGCTAHASVITLATGFSPQGAQASAEDYRAVVESALAQPAQAGYGSTALDSYEHVTNQGTFGASGNIAWKSTIEFGVSNDNAGLWSFRTGVDFGFGGAMFVDGVAIAMRSTDMWWAGSYANPSQFLQGSASLGAGQHTLSIYGLEGCCDGFQQAQFQIGANGFNTFAANDGLVADVPEPATLATFGLGLGMVVGLRSRRNRRVVAREFAA